MPPKLPANGIQNTRSLIGARWICPTADLYPTEKVTLPLGAAFFTINGVVSCALGAAGVLDLVVP